ncbi:MAG TPA: bifunctional phosphopantothenoylcysteine decarboxylase/phosphopantothenate--cysteine ligase CoaBC [Hyphomicrobiaceae bacterium]|nr:bifunctional phosphopantothenoylcysteine decarboxylase/phosphopantothenate--cysteine ligase CoaBC [Hyphomicrobiaceae bacterium]
MASTLKRILLVIGGGIAAYKCLELIRRARDRGFSVRAVMTPAARHFVTPLSVGALTNDRVFCELFDLNDEREIGHIRLARDTDLIVVAPATADFLAKMAGGHADDLASAVLLATDRPVLAAPAMNPRMWLNPATRRNIALLQSDGINFVGPNSGEMAEANEAGPGRMAEPAEILAAIERILGVGTGPLSGRHILITAGPTHEPIDPVRYIANRSSGKQGYALAAAAAALGARVTLVAGPTNLRDPQGVACIHVESATQMLEAARKALPADAAIFAAAVADWRVASASGEKIKKDAKHKTPQLELVENPDILKTIAHERPGTRPALVVGFAAETEHVIEYAKKKRKAKGCDWIVANDVSAKTGVMGGDRNAVHLISASGVDSWPEMDKAEVAERLVTRVADYLASNTGEA